MTNRTCSKRMVPALLGVALIAGTAISADLDTSGQAGQYANSIATVRVKGAAGDFAPSTVYAPFILLNDQALAGQPALVNPRQAFINTPQIQSINGIPVGYLTTFFTDPANTMADRKLTVIGTTDAAGGGFSNNVILDEGTANKSNSPGAITPAGDIVFLERFGGGQNNMGVFTGITGVLPQTPAPSNIPPLKVLSTAAVGVGNATETGINPSPAGGVRGSIFTGTPSADRDSVGDLYSGNTHFNGAPSLLAGEFAATINGVAVYQNFGNDPRAGTANDSNGGTIGPGMAAGWLQQSVPLPTNPAGESRGDARQTQPHVVNVRTPSGEEVIYVVHGVGFSGSTPFTGGSARVLYLVVDQLRPDYAGGNAVPENNSIIIEADAVGGVGSVHGAPYTLTNPAPLGFADHWNSDPNQRFVDHVATGGAADVSSTSRFDMNGKGQVVALHEDRNVSPTQLQVRVYDPTWNAAQNRITGYTLSAIVVTNGDLDDNLDPIALLEARNTSETSPGVFIESSIDTISAPAIDDDGRVAFVGITQAFTVLGDWDSNPFTPQTLYLQNTTNTLYVWEPTTGSTHRVIRGGQTGDTLTDSFPGGGIAPFVDNNLSIGVFATNSDATDAFGRGSFSREGGLLTIAFRSSGNQFVGGVNQEFETRPNGTVDTFIDRGGLLYAPGQLGINEKAVRGALVVELGAFAATPPCCPGNADKVTGPGQVDFNDINAVIGNWLANYGAGTGPGDADCDGLVNFNDINSVIGNWLSICP